MASFAMLTLGYLNIIGNLDFETRDERTSFSTVTLININNWLIFGLFPICGIQIIYRPSEFLNKLLLFWNNLGLQQYCKDCTKISFI